MSVKGFSSITKMKATYSYRQSNVQCREIFQHTSTWRSQLFCFRESLDQHVERMGPVEREKKKTKNSKQNG